MRRPGDEDAASVVVAIAGRDLVDANELARRLKVTRWTVWRWAKIGRVPYYAVGRRWMFDPTEVLAALRVPAGRDGVGGAW